jgi:hypothetical protein
VADADVELAVAVTIHAPQAGPNTGISMALAHQRVLASSTETVVFSAVADVVVVVVGGGVKVVQ